MAEDKKLRPASDAAIQEFLNKAASLPVKKSTGEKCGRLIFGMDATASRQPAWDRACQIQGQMFVETAALGGLAIQLVYYRGFHEFYAGAWHTDSQGLLTEMTRAACAGGLTQISRLLRHAQKENAREKVHAVVFVGDCMEEEVDRLAHEAGKLGMAGVPVFVFQEGLDAVAEKAFREIAKLSGGAWCSFDAGSARQLRDLLGAVAVFAAGGRRALLKYGEGRGGAALRLTRQFGGGR